jgi:hypothetical protein
MTIEIIVVFLIGLSLGYLLGICVIYINLK